MPRIEGCLSAVTFYCVPRIEGCLSAVEWYGMKRQAEGDKNADCSKDCRYRSAMRLRASGYGSCTAILGPAAS